MGVVHFLRRHCHGWEAREAIEPDVREELSARGLVAINRRLVVGG
jgi:hypothetical protein